MRVVIIGNGAAGLSALETFRSRDRAAAVAVVSAEGRRPYSRVQLPYYLKGRTERRHLFVRAADFLERLGAEFIDATVEDLDTERRRVHLSRGRSISFDRLLIASGSRPRVPAVTGLAGTTLQHVWTLAQVEALKPAFLPGKRILIIGAGFIAMQIAWAAVQAGLAVTLTVRSTVMRKDLDDDGRAILERRLHGHGVKVLRNQVPGRIEAAPDGTFIAHLPHDPPVACDLVLSAAGIEPNLRFVRNGTVARDAAILVDARMRTSVPGIFAAGDVAAGPTAFGDRHAVHGLWPSALEQGRVAGFNMAGRSTLYSGSLNMNVTELFGLSVACMGRFGERDGDRVFTCRDDEGGDDYMKIVLNEGVPVGALCVGPPERVAVLGMLRPLIRQHKRLETEPERLLETLQARLFRGALRPPGYGNGIGAHAR